MNVTETQDIDNRAALLAEIATGLTKRNYPAALGRSQIRVASPHYDNEHIVIRREHLFEWNVALWSNGRILEADRLIVRRDVPDDAGWLTNGLAGVLRSMWSRHYDERQEARRRR